MYFAVYKGMTYRVTLKEDEVTLISHNEDEGFEIYVDIKGRVSSTTFIKKVAMDDLDYLYRIHYEIQYRGHFFYVSSAMNRMNIADDWFEIKPSIKQNQLRIDLDFKQINKLEWAKEIHRKDIEVLKIIEEPMGRFINQGLKIKLLKDKEIDEFLDSIKG